MDVSAGGVVYEVDLAVEAAIAAEYRAWLRGHVAAMLALPGFRGAQVLEVLDPEPAPGFAGLRVQYRLEDEAACAAYLREHAPRMRAEGIAQEAIDMIFKSNPVRWLARF